MGKKEVLVIAGPTASGKSSYALDLALQQEGVILNGDSLQLYKGLPLLTAQPPPEAKEAVPHFLYEISPPDAPLCSAGQWLAKLHPLLEDILDREQTPIVVGGSGFYLLALTKGLSPIPPVPSEIQQALQQRPLHELYAELCHVDPLCAARLNPHDSQRILRALAVWHTTGKSLSQWQSYPRMPLPYEFRTEILIPKRELLWQKIENRLQQMIQDGVFEEVRHFIEALSPQQLQQSPLNRALGFEFIKAFWEKNLTHQEAFQKTLEKTRQYAKRQLTWFRHQAPTIKQKRR